MLSWEDAMNEVEHGEGCGCLPDPPPTGYRVESMAVGTSRWRRVCPPMSAPSANVQDGGANHVAIDPKLQGVQPD